MASVARRSGRAGAPPRRAVLAWRALAVIVRSGYVPLAFGSRRLWAATADSALLCVVMARYASLGRRVDQTAAALAVPEIAWTAFATVLSAPVSRREEQLTGGLALFQLATELPAAVLARPPGIHIKVAFAWQHASAGDWLAYAAGISRHQED